MKKRKLERVQKKKKQQRKNDFVMSLKAESTAQAATQNTPTIDCIGNFIFFSTPTGEAWLLDHRNNYALRLADNSRILPYKIIETKERFQIEWKERFRIEGDIFISSYKGDETCFQDYPIDAINGLIRMIKQKGDQKGSPKSNFL